MCVGHAAVVTPASTGPAAHRYQPGIGGVDLCPLLIDSRVVGIGVLGPLTVDGVVTVLSPRDRVVLAVLAMHAGAVVSAGRLADALWGERPPASAMKVLQGCIVRLRKALGPVAIQTVPQGYRLALPAEEVDAVRFERLVGRGRELLSLGEPERAAYLVDEALALWRGPALAELADWDAGQVEARRLEELRLDAEDLRLETMLRAGRHREVLATARAMVEAAPLRERRWALLALAQYQSGQQGEALRSLGQARRVLAGELGLDPGPDLVALEEAILRQDPALVAETALPPPRPSCPYRGLVPYDVGDAEDFYGRDDDVAAGLRKLSAVGALVVTGPSGSGKSSLIRAGLAAALERDGQRVVIITPGPHPVDALTVLPRAGPAPVLVVDQCEEAVWLCTDPAERAGFFTALTAYAERAPLIVAVRADRLGDLSAYPGFARLVERGLYLLNPLTADQLRAAIEGPARGAGLRLEPGLTDLLVREVEGEPGALPLLSHALRATWERREANTLTVTGYQDTGGIRGAVARSAETVYQQVPAEQRPALRDLLLRLVAPNPEGDPMRSRVPRRLVAGKPEHERLVETLVAARLVTSDDGVVELAHEALARAWPRLQDWLEEDVEGQRILRHLSIAADTWDSMGRPDSEVYRGTRLTKAVEWRDRVSPDLTTVEQDFLQAGERLQRDELQAAVTRAEHQRRINRRLRAVALALALLLLAVSGLGVLAARLWRQADALAASTKSRVLIDEADTLTNTRLAMLLTATAYQLDHNDEALAGLSRMADQYRDVTELIAAGANSVAFSPTDPDLLASTEDDRVVLRDLGRDAPVARIPGTGYQDVAFSPDGHTLALLDATSLRVSTRGRAPVVLDRWQSGYVEAIQLSPTGRHVAGCVERGLRVWPVRTRATPRTIPIAGPCLFGFTRAGRAIAFIDPDGSTMVTWHLGLDRIVRRTPLPMPPPEFPDEEPVIDSFAVTPDGKTAVFTACCGEPLTWWDIDRAVRLPAPPHPYLGTTEINFNASGDTAVTSSPLALLDTGRRAPLRAFDQPDVGFGPTLSADGRRLAAAAGGSILLFDTSLASGLPVDAHEVGLADPAHVTTVQYSGGFEEPEMVLAAWDRENPERTVTTVITVPVFGGGALSPDGRLYAQPTDRNGIILWDARHGRRLPGRLVGHDKAPAVMAFDPTGEYLAASDGRQVRIWEVPAGRLRSTIEPPERHFETGLELSPGGRYVALLDDVQGPSVWDTTTQRQLAGLPTSADDYYELTFSTNGSWLGIASSDEVTVWDIERAAPILTMPGTGPVAFSPDGRLLAIARRPTDATISYTDIEVRTLDGGALRGAIRIESLSSLVFTPDSNQIVTAGGNDGIVSFHRLDPSWALEHLCSLADRNLTRKEWDRYLGGFEYFDACA
jgi:DNA-binding SARP family transcriptional activator/WD40 repeat protein